MLTRTLTAAALASLLVATSASAQEARELFVQGQAAYETGDYQNATSLWERAYELDPRPLLQYNLAQAYERLGQLDEAVAAYRVYVDQTPGDDERARNARARIASLEQRVSQTGIVMTGGVEGAQVLIDGEDRGRLPHPDPFRVEAGSHRVIVRAEGYEDFVSSVAVSAGQQASLPVEMRAGVAGSAGGGGGGVWLPGAIIAAGGAAVLIGGAVTGGLALSAAGSAPNSTGDEAQSARTLALVTDILIPAGAVIAVTGIILMFVVPSGDDGDSARVVPLVGPTFAGLSVEGSL